MQEKDDDQQSNKSNRFFKNNSSLLHSNSQDMTTIIGCVIWMGEGCPEGYIETLSSFIEFNRTQKSIKFFVFYSSRYYDLPKNFDNLFSTFSKEDRTDIKFEFIDIETHPDYTKNKYVNWLEQFDPPPFAYISDYLRFRILECESKRQEHRQSIIIFMELDIKFSAPLSFEKLKLDSITFPDAVTYHLIIVNQASKKCYRVLENMCIAYENLYKNLLSKLPLTNTQLYHDLLNEKYIYLACSNFDLNINEKEISFSANMINKKIASFRKRYNEGTIDSNYAISFIECFKNDYYRISLRYFYTIIQSIPQIVNWALKINSDSGINYENYVHIATHLSSSGIYTTPNLIKDSLGELSVNNKDVNGINDIPRQNTHLDSLVYNCLRLNKAERTKQVDINSRVTETEFIKIIENELHFYHCEIEKKNLLKSKSPPLSHTNKSAFSIFLPLQKFEDCSRSTDESELDGQQIQPTGYTT